MTNNEIQDLIVNLEQRFSDRIRELEIEMNFEIDNLHDIIGEVS